MLVLICAFRAMQYHHISPPGIEDYHTARPQGSRRTAAGASVKLFAATVTSVGLRGHLHSLIGMKSWQYELYRAVEMLVKPLATLFSFSTLVWYSFVEVLNIAPGPCERGTTLKYRFARLCGCTIDTPSGNKCIFPLGLVSPRYIKAIPLARDLKWGGRVLVLFILLGQYIQAVVLLIRRFLADAAAGIDCAMTFLVLAGITTLLQSLTISLLDVSWTLREDFRPCTEKLCNIPRCVIFKGEQGYPSTTMSENRFGRNVGMIHKAVLHELAGGWLQLSLLSRNDHSIWRSIMTFWFLQISQRCSLYYVFYVEGFRELVIKDKDPRHSQNTQVENQYDGEALSPVSSGAQLP